jgi:polysaccharide export outer membrane protein
MVVPAVVFLVMTLAASGQTQDLAVTQGEFHANTLSADTPSNSQALPVQEYRVGQDDLLEITVFEVMELNTTARISDAGVITLPLIGPLTAAGRTTQELERTIEDALSEKYINNPHVTVFVKEYGSQPVSVVGAVRMPGIYQIKGQKSLLDMLALAQGLNETAGKTIQLIRAGSAPGLADPSNHGEVVSVDAQDLFENGKTDLNLPVHAGDAINVLQAGSIFVVGEVMHPSEFVLRNGKNVTATQAIALANGFTKEAKQKGCVVMRYHRDGTKEEIPVDASKVLRGKIEDIKMMPNDILYVPPSKISYATNRSLDLSIATVISRLVWSGF